MVRSIEREIRANISPQEPMPDGGDVHPAMANRTTANPKSISFFFMVSSILRGMASYDRARAGRQARVGLGALAGSAAHGTGDLGKDLANVCRNAGHNCTSGNSDKAGHKSIFDEVLAFCVEPDSGDESVLLDHIHV